MKRTLAALATGLALLATPAAADDAKIGDIVITKPWTRVTPPGAKVAGGFMKITNTGKTADRLVGGSIAIANKLEVHEMTMDGGMMKMREVAGGLEIKPGDSVELKPGSYHVMFIDLMSPPAEGKPVKGTLQFEKAGKVDISYDVAPMGAKAEGQQGHHGKH